MRTLIVILASAGVLACGSDSGSGGGGTQAADAGGYTGACTNGGLYADQACNPLCPAESGCAEGEDCTFLPAGGGFGCQKDGTQKLGMGCNPETLCAVGGCVDIPDVGSKCASFCKEDGDCGAEERCGIEVDYGGAESIGMCSPKPPGCDIFDQDCQEEGTACYLAGEAMCLKVGEVVVGEPCATANGCEKGLICVSEKCQTPCNPSTGGPDPKCHLVCPDRTGMIEGISFVAICTIPDDEPACNLLNDQCEDGKACYFTPDGPRCRAVGSTPSTGDCQVSEDCKPGNVCWPSGSTCKPTCKKDDAVHSECGGAAAQCSNLYGPVGFCDE